MGRLLIEAAISGFLTGGVLALIGLGLTVIWGVMGILNLAHTDFLMVAMFAVFLIVEGLNIHPYFTLPIMIPLFFILGALVMRLLIKSVAHRHGIPVIITIGLMLLFQNGARLIMHAATPLYSVNVNPQFWTGTFSIGGTNISLPRLLAFLVSVTVAVLLYWIIQKTEMGRAVRAYAEDSTVASLMGINVTRIQLVVFGIGIACVGAAACLLVPIYATEPQIGRTFMFSVFAIVAMGGAGNFWGTIFAGLAIGIIEGIANVFVPGAAIPMVSLGILILVMTVRPQGIFGARGQWLGF